MSCAGTAGTAVVSAGLAAAVACVARVAVAGLSSAAAGARGASAAGVVCRRTKHEPIVVLLVARDAPAADGQPASPGPHMRSAQSAGPPARRALRLFDDAVVLHDVL